MKNSLLAVFSMFLVACSEPTPNNQCVTDSDCRNGEHCNLFFRACEADTYDASVSDSSIADAGNSSVADSFSLNVDAPTSTEDAYNQSPDSSATTRNFALRFDGDSDKVSLSAIPGIGRNFTFEAWVRPSNAVYSSDIGGFIFQRRAARQDVTLFFSRDSSQRFGFQVNGTIVQANNISSLNEWHHVAGVLYNGNTSIYVDGVLEGRTSGAEVVVWDLDPRMTPNEFVIGREGMERTTTRGVFIGDIDEIRISSSSRYIENTYSVPLNLTSDSSTAAMFELNDNDSTVHSTVGDISGSLVGGTWIPCDR